jgi:AraC-like DNA-binding protein
MRNLSSSSDSQSFLRTSARHLSKSNGGNVNSDDGIRWIVSPGVRSTYIGDGAVLLNVKEGLCYSLDGVAAQVWVTLEGSPAGISFEGIVDVLETHSTVIREELESAARDCVGTLQLEGLVQQKDASLRRSSMREGQTVIPEQPFVQRLDTVESLIDQLFPQRVESNTDWRANKLKNFIDSAPGEVNESLGHICSQLQLSLSYRQARRLFKESAGISMKEYARKRRLVFAARKLESTDDPIKVIATDAGYRTPQGFERAFYGLFRLKPMEFRKMWQRSLVTR